MHWNIFSYAAKKQLRWINFVSLFQWSVDDFVFYLAGSVFFCVAFGDKAGINFCKAYSLRT